VATLKSIATGQPLEQRKMRVGADGRLSTTLPLRENDVYLLKLLAVK
jgi:xylan 1,4-beta-xylosidase